jgi:hypothetical protein
MAVFLVFIVATPESPGSNRSAISVTRGSFLPRHCPASRLIASLPRSDRWRENGWGSAQNLATSRRIQADEAYLRSRHVYLTQWGPGRFTNKIVIYLAHYSARAARILYTRYGCAVVVSRHSQPPGHLLDHRAG